MITTFGLQATSFYSNRAPRSAGQVRVHRYGNLAPFCRRNLEFNDSPEVEFVDGGVTSCLDLSCGGSCPGGSGRLECGAQAARHLGIIILAAGTDVKATRSRGLRLSVYGYRKYLSICEWRFEVALKAHSLIFRCSPFLPACYSAINGTPSQTRMASATAEDGAC